MTTNVKEIAVRYRDIRNPSIRPGLRLVAFVLVRASIDEIADQAEQRERNHNDNADDKRKIQAVRTVRVQIILSAVAAVMKSRGLASLAVFVAVLGVCGADAGQAPQQTRQRIDVAKLGPQVGQQVPDFNLRDQTGRMRNLQSVMGPRGAMLVFIRSADW
jgi:hypothetical protein